MLLLAVFQSLNIRETRQVVSIKGAGLDALFAGLRYIGRTRVLLGAITFDFFAGLMAGVNALLPVFARDILHTGPAGLGFIRGATAVGAIIVAGFLGMYPIKDRAGPLIFVTVSIYGVAAIAFGLSEILWLSVGALAIMGAADVCSSYFRWSVVQLWTPDDVRGRVSAVTSITGSGGAEIGNFRAGMMAGLLGPVPAVVLGGVLAIVGCVLWARMFPEVLRVRNLAHPEEFKPGGS
jgi:MFS family permease